MIDVPSIVLLLIFSLIGLVCLGFFAGFSPVLYIAQASQTLKSSQRSRYTIALMSGVLLAIVLLMLVFQAANLTSLLQTVSPPATALVLSIVLNSLIGVLFILAGFYSISKRNFQSNHLEDMERVKNIGTLSAFFGFGFAKTLLSISGATAVFIASNIIAGSTTSLFERTLFTAVFLAASVAPFIAVFYLLQRKSARLQKFIVFTETNLQALNYRATLGVAAIVFGTAIVIFNVMMALFY
jgi:hypothetical protein